MLAPTPVVALNRAVAVGEVHGPAAALDLIDRLHLPGYHALHATRADLLRRLGRLDQAGGRLRHRGRPDLEPSGTGAPRRPGRRPPAVEPAGDVLLADLAREAVSDTVSGLKTIAGGRCPITLEAIDTTISHPAEREVPGRGGDAVVWEEVEARTGEESELSVSFLALLVIATLLAAVGVLLDSPVLIVGAMVVGPEYGAVARVAVASPYRVAPSAPKRPFLTDA